MLKSKLEARVPNVSFNRFLIQMSKSNFVLTICKYFIMYFKQKYIDNMLINRNELDSLNTASNSGLNLFTLHCHAGNKNYLISLNIE